MSNLTNETNKQTTTKQGGDVNYNVTAVIIGSHISKLPMFAFRFEGGVPDGDEVLHFSPQGGESKGVLPFGQCILSLSSTTHGFS